MSKYGNIRNFELWSRAERCASGLCNLDAFDDAVRVALKVHGPLIELAGRTESELAVADWLPCCEGDVAAHLDLSLDGGMRVNAHAGHRSSCREVAWLTCGD